MKLDDNIEQTLKAQTRELDALMEEKQSLADYLKTGLSSNLGWIMKAGYVLAFLFSVLLIYCGYRFFVATAQEELFWGVCFIASLQVQIATKLWIYMQTDRACLSRELRLLALAKNK
ncbi:DUF6768 family protein [Alteromonas sp. H39]|uniref:DUF6768 family protein n=1 Tax=Alteromonas sp. H39 TaxID=3389876 RepID=UPI0039E16506